MHKCITYWLLNATTVLHSKHAANMFSLVKNPSELYTQ